MARRATTASTSAETTVAATPIRRRRRRTVIDHAAQTKILVGSLIKARCGAGVSQPDTLTAVQWARDVHEEVAALKVLTARVRKAKSEGVAERLVALDVNKALLEGVLSGELLIDVADGTVTFRDGRDPLPLAG